MQKRMKVCCNSCTFCTMFRATAKGRLKSQSLLEIKYVKGVNFCISFLFCPSCPKCCRNSRGDKMRTFNMRTPLSRSPLIISGYASPLGNSYLKEALYSLMEKPAVENVLVWPFLAFCSGKCLGFYNRLL